MRQNARRLPAIVIAALLALALASLAAALPAKGGKPPTFTLKSLDGKSVSLDQIRKPSKKTDKGRVVLLTFWATWCPHCVDESAALQKLHERYAAKGLSIVGIALDTGGADDVKPFVKSHKLGYTVLLDPKGEVAQRYGVRPIPVTIILDRSGKVYNTHLGYGEGMDVLLEREISALLK